MKLMWTVDTYRLDHENGYAKVSYVKGSGRWFAIDLPYDSRTETAFPGRSFATSHQAQEYVETCLEDPYLAYSDLMTTIFPSTP